MDKHSRGQAQAAVGFTLIELMIVVALVAIVLSLAGPSFRDYLLMQRLRSAQGQLETDLNYARSEAISRNTFVQLRVQSQTGMSCYVIYSRPDRDMTSPCDCTASAGSRCGSGRSEIKTVQFPSGEGVSVGPTSTASADNYFLTISPRTGGSNMISMVESLVVTDFSMLTQLDATRSFRTSITAQGRVQVCAPSGSTVGGTPC